VRTCALLVHRLAAARRVADAIMIIDYVSRAGVSSMDEVIFCSDVLRNIIAPVFIF
jgi:hypothetical protein